MKKPILVIVFLIAHLVFTGQAVYEPMVNNPLYELLDELAALKVITINSSVKPYSRVFIANKLWQALQSADKLNKRQIDEIKFYLTDYSFEAGLNNNLINGNPHTATSIRDSGYGNPHTASFNLNPISFRLNSEVFKLNASPMLGTRFMVNENGSFLEVSAGGEVYGYLARHIGYYVNVAYVHQNQPLVNPVMFTTEQGKSWNYQGDGSVYNTEWMGGLSAGWKWGEFGVFKDRPVWGNANHGSNIISGHPPSFPYMQLHLKPAKWIEFYCITGFLKSNVIDSSRSNFTPGSEQIKYHKKYFSANFFTVTPWKGLDISVGNSIIWSDVFKVAYLIPFNLYKSVDESMKGSYAYSGNVITNDDGHLFMDISSRNIKHLQLYLGWWIDDWVSSYFLDPKLHNAFGWKMGVSLYDLPVKNLSLTVEGSINRPRIYQEYIPAHTYANDDYNFGNYLRDDSWELYVLASYKPIRGLNVSASFDIAQRGGFQYDIDDYTTYPIAKNLIFNQTCLNLGASYRFTTNLRANIGYTFNQHAGDIQYIPEIMRGKTNSLIIGINLGL